MFARFFVDRPMFSGMLGVTVFGLFFTPAFYLIVRRFASKRSRQ